MIDIPKNARTLGTICYWNLAMLLICWDTPNLPRGSVIYSRPLTKNERNPEHAFITCSFPAYCTWSFPEVSMDVGCNKIVTFYGTEWPAGALNQSRTYESNWSIISQNMGQPTNHISIYIYIYTYCILCTSIGNYHSSWHPPSPGMVFQ